MARGNFKSEAFAKGGTFGPQDGNYEVVEAEVAAHQFPANSKTGHQSEPFCAMRLKLVKLDSDLIEVKGEPEEIEFVENFKIGSLEFFRPGNLNNPQDLDEEPEDLGTEVGTTGNSLWQDPDKKMFAKFAWPQLVMDMEKAGFKTDVLALGYAPAFVGMKFHLKIQEEPKYKGWTKEENPTRIAVDKIFVYPYEKKKEVKKAGKPATTAPAASKANGKAVETKVSTGENVGENPNPSSQIIGAAIGQLELKGEMSLKDFQKVVNGYMFKNSKTYPPASQKIVVATMKDADALTEIGQETGAFMFDADEGMLTFAE